MLFDLVLFCLGTLILVPIFWAIFHKNKQTSPEQPAVTPTPAPVSEPTPVVDSTPVSTEPTAEPAVTQQEAPAPAPKAKAKSGAARTSRRKAS